MDEKKKKAKILVLAPFNIWPPHFGSSERIYNLAKQLAYNKQFHLFVLYTDYAQVQTETRHKEHWLNATIIGLGPSRRWAQAFNPGLILKGLMLTLRERPELIICAHLWAGLHAIILHLLTGVPFILDEHNAEYVRFKRMQKKATGLVQILEKATCRLATKVICVSEADKNHLTDLGIKAKKISIVPNAVDVTQYRPNSDARYKVRKELGLADNQPFLLFFGKLDYQPNAEAVEIIVREIMPRILVQIPQALFVICGHNPPVNEYIHPNLVFPGLVPRIEDYINASDVVIVPLTSGGGTKFKIIQAVACGKPVVTTLIGAEGIKEADEWMQIAGDWDKFAQLTQDILSHPLRDMSHKTLKRFRHHYSWAHMTMLATRVIEAQLIQA